VPDQVVLFTDFSAPSRGGFLRALFSRRPPDSEVGTGSSVLLRDHEGNSCSATVVEIRGDLILLQPDWETWVDGDEPVGSKSNRAARHS
jgi:hypothetical protein